MLDKGFEVCFLDLETGEKRMCKYGSRRAFDLEWKLCYDINDVEVSYKEIDYYQE